MFRTIPSGTILYRAAAPHYTRKHILSGRGTFYSSKGGRYNRPGVQALYMSDDPGVIFSEMAYYAAQHWQTLKIPNGTWTNAITYPFIQEYRLWAFRLARAVQVVDIEDHMASATFRYPPYVLLNPSQAYAATQDLAGTVLTHSTPVSPAPQSGLLAPSVRVRSAGHVGGDSQVVFFIAARLPRLRFEQVWGMTVEFFELSPSSRPVAPTTTRVDWASAAVQVDLLRTSQPTPAIQSPGSIVCGTPHTVRINYS